MRKNCLVDGVMVRVVVVDVELAVMVLPSGVHVVRLVEVSIW